MSIASTHAANAPANAPTNAPTNAKPAGTSITTQQSMMVRAGVEEALADPRVRRAWAKLIARSVAKGVFFGGIALALLAIAAWIALAQLVLGR